MKFISTRVRIYMNAIRNPWTYHLEQIFTPVVNLKNFPLHLNNIYERSKRR
jgi:hypothetical protein